MRKRQAVAVYQRIQRGDGIKPTPAPAPSKRASSTFYDKLQRAYRQYM